MALIFSYMNSKKISAILIILVPFISGCTFSGLNKKVDFASLYKEHTISQVQSFQSIAERLGYIGKYETK